MTDDVEAVLRSLPDQRALPASTAEHLTAAILERRWRSRDEPVGPELTDRELSVLRLVARGLTASQVAGELFISEVTVRNHLRNVGTKLDLQARMTGILGATRPEHRIGDEVRVTSGPFQDFRGEVVAIAEDGAVTVEVLVFGRPTRVTLTQDLTEPA